ncbi:MAG: TetR/AcrR family transcriptional regulator [Anaerolineales bacterium]
MTEDTLSKGERTQQTIEEAAYELFLEQGYSATSMRRIAERAGLALGGIYNHFSSKEEIFEAIILDKHPYKQILPVILSAPGNTLTDFVHNAAHALVDELGKRPDFIRLMFIEIVEFNSKHMPVFFDEIFPEFLPLVQRFQAPDGELRPIPLPLLLRAFLGMFFSFYMTELITERIDIPEMHENALDSFVEIFLHGILVEKETNHV